MFLRLENTKKVKIKMNEEQESIALKIVLVGEAGVGKTSIISQFIDQIFQEDLQASTGGTFSSKTLILNNGKTIRFDIWDTAGEERYRSLTKLFYKDSNAAILVYDITRKESFDELKSYWANQIKELADSNIILVVAANKSDLSEKEEVDEAEARKLAEELNAIYCTTSAKNSIGIDDLFLQIARKFFGNNDIIITKKEGKKEEKAEKDEQDEQMFNKVGTMRLSREKSVSTNKDKKGCC